MRAGRPKEIDYGPFKKCCRNCSHYVNTVCTITGFKHLPYYPGKIGQCSKFVNGGKS